MFEFKVVDVKEYAKCYRGYRFAEGEVVLGKTDCLLGHLHPAGHGEYHLHRLVVGQGADMLQSDTKVFMDRLRSFVSKNEPRAELRVSEQSVEDVKVANERRKITNPDNLPYAPEGKYHVHSPAVIAIKGIYRNEFSMQFCVLGPTDWDVEQVLKKLPGKIKIGIGNDIRYFKGNIIKKTDFSFYCEFSYASKENLKYSHHGGAYINEDELRRLFPAVSMAVSYGITGHIDLAYGQKPYKGINC